jgi:hypothetical protein
MFCEKVCFGEIIVFNRRATLEMLSLRGDGQPAAEHLKVGEPNLLRNAENTVSETQNQTRTPLSPGRTDRKKLRLPVAW